MYGGSLPSGNSVPTRIFHMRAALYCIFGLLCGGLITAECALTTLHTGQPISSLLRSMGVRSMGCHDDAVNYIGQTPKCVSSIYEFQTNG